MKIAQLCCCSLNSVATGPNKKMIIEKTTGAFLEAVAKGGGPPIYKLAPQDARNVLRGAQSGPVEKMPADIEDRMIPFKHEISICILRPQGNKNTLPVVMYFHGGGWVLGDKDTHDRLIREICNGAKAAVVFVNYTPSPEAHYPVPIEEAYAATKWVAEHAKEINVDASKLAVAGDSVGGNMAASDIACKGAERPAHHIPMFVLPRYRCRIRHRVLQTIQGRSLANPGSYEMVLGSICTRSLSLG